MKVSSLLRHIGIAMMLSSLAAIVETIFTGLLSSKLNISLIVFLYLTYLIWQSHLAAGRITLLVFNLCVLLIFLFKGIHLVTLLWVYLAIIWLNRSLLYYSSLLSVLADLGLCLFSASIAYWLLSNDYGLVSIMLCLLLLQGLHCLIVDKKIPSKSQTSSADNFNHALKSAESALQQLIR